MKSLLLAIAAAVSTPHALGAAQEAPLRRVEARVVALSQASFYIDAGEDAGLEPGDRVVARPLGGAPIEGTLRALSRRSARCELTFAAPGLYIGAPVEILVPASRSKAAPAPNDGWPWTHPAEVWDPGTPLLAPARSTTARERDAELHGLLYSSVDVQRSSEPQSQTYALARTGFDFQLDNAAGGGERLRFAATALGSVAEFGDGQDDERALVRLDRLSWRAGGDQPRSFQLEVGRFQSSELPQLGLLDGVECVQLLANGDRLGASAGFLPEWTAQADSGKDLAFALFYRGFAGSDRELSFAAAAQKSWHEGQRDRDLLLGEIDWAPTPATFLRASAWVDFYDGADAPKANEVELTEAHASGGSSFGEHSGAELSYSHVRWPVLLREPPAPVLPSTLSDGRLDRAGVRAWFDLAARTRMWARVDAWESASDRGHSVELSCDVREALREQCDLEFTLIESDAQFSSLVGARLGARTPTSWGAWRLAYEFTDHQQHDFDGEQRHLLQHAALGSCDARLGDAWSLAVRADLRFGEQIEATTVSLHLQGRL